MIITYIYCNQHFMVSWEKCAILLKIKLWFPGIKTESRGVFVLPEHQDFLLTFIDGQSSSVIVPLLRLTKIRSYPGIFNSHPQSTK